MAISLDCITAALNPFARDQDLNLDDWLNPARLLAKASASNFNLRSGEFSTFDLWWKLAEPARDLHEREHKPDGSGAIDAEVKQAFVRLAAIVNDGAKYSELGYRHVRRVSGKGRFVIFSDHHMAFPGSRQDFFRSSGNSELYSEILDEYAESGFTLIENGDVEELIIHEPMLPPPQGLLELQDKVDTKNPQDVGWRALDESRVQWRLLQLNQVILNHSALYDQINKQFVDQGRYIRIAGNHDQDTQDPRFFDILRTKYPKLDTVYDFLIIEAADDKGPTFVVCHGHHFDTVATPKYSRRIGETLSECLGWPYEGADRVWRWDGMDGVQRWANGGEAFFNTLVTDDFDQFELTFGEVVKAGLATWLGSQIGGLGGPVLAAVGGIIGMASSLAHELSNPALWETNFRHNIAWEYFQSSDPGEALFNELYCGKRWIKFRHLDEIFINERLESAFDGSKVPYLVLGHSHEPRQRSWNPANSTQAEHYLNSGAAGRFQNLIWCVEIMDGVSQVVAWHRPGGPQSGTAPERRTYTPDVIGHVGRLVASDRHVPLPPLEEEKKRWLEPVLHMMMS